MLTNTTRSLRKYELAAALTLFCIAFAAYAVAWRQAPLMHPDSPTYMALARDIKAGNITHFSQRTPGLPLLMLATGSETQPTRALFYVHLALHFASVGLMAWLLAFLETDRRLIRLLLLAGVTPVFVAPAAFADSEILCEFFVVCILVSLVLWLVKQRFAWAVLFGVACLGAAFVRPAFQFLCPVLAAAVLLAQALGVFPNRSLIATARGLIAPVLIAVLGVAAYAMFNYQRFGFFSTCSLLPYQLSTRTATFVEDLPDEFSGVRSILLRHRDAELVRHFGNHTSYDYIHPAMREVIAYYGNDSAKALRIITRANTWLILHKPMSYLIESLRSSGTYWLPIEYPEIGPQGGIWRAASAAVQMGISVLVLGLGVVMAGAACVWTGIRLKTRAAPPWSDATERRAAAYALSMTLIIYSAIVSSFGGTGLARYRVTSALVILGCCVLGAGLLRRMVEAGAAAIRQRREPIGIGSAVPPVDAG